MVRPEQVRFDLEPAARPSAIVHAVQPVGAVAEVSLLAGGDDPIVVELTVPLHELGALRPGSRVALRIDGGAVLYPADAVRPSDAHRRSGADRPSRAATTV
jgi:iron(III) transport system ATP-binding protein